MKRPWLLPLVPLWAAMAAWKNRAFDRSPARTARLARPVVSVGSLSAGGAGKTPFVIALGHALQRRGMAVDVLSRGYGRSDVDMAKRVEPGGTAEQFGDEPLLMARALSVPVYVASQRVYAGRLAEADAANNAAMHLLDDGFQHRQLARAVDIVLVTEQDVQDTLLPAGDLREPLRSLRRASIVVVRQEESTALQPVLARLFAGRQVPLVWAIQRAFAVVEGTPTRRPFAFCGIARPDGFRAALEWHGIAPVGFAALRDHQKYDDAMVDRLVTEAQTAGADGFVTTAKDAVKLSAKLCSQLATVGPLAVGDITVHLADEERCIQHLTAMLPSASSAQATPHRMLASEP